MRNSKSAQEGIPVWLRWIALVWLMFWVVVYARYWGLANFMHLCDIAVVLSSLGLWSNNRLLISSQAVASLLADTAWGLDAGWRFFLGRHLVGGTEYLFDARFPLWVRLLSLYHLVMPLLLLWALYRVGYDRRGWALQSAITLPALVGARFTSPAANVNFVFRDPVFHRAWTPAPAYLAVLFLLMVFVAYFPAHALFKRLFPYTRQEASQDY